MENKTSEYQDYEETIPNSEEECQTVKTSELVNTNSSSHVNMSTLVENCSMALDSTQNIVNMYSQCKQVKEHTEQMRILSQVETAKIIAKYKSCQDFLSKTFGERDKALTKHYNLLDKAVASNDREMILASLRGISSIVTKSPLDDFDKFVELYNDTSQPLLDF
jgi:hypothetical protein